jgi:hypothetical protein
MCKQILHIKYIKKYITLSINQTFKTTDINTKNKNIKTLKEHRKTYFMTNKL